MYLLKFIFKLFFLKFSFIHSVYISFIVIQNLQSLYIFISVLNVPVCSNYISEINVYKKK